MVASAITSNPVVLGGSRFFRWWFDELAACLPGVLRSVFSRNRQLVEVEVDRHRVVLSRIRNRSRHLLGTVDLSDTASQSHRDAVQRIMRRANLRSDEIAVLVPRSQTLRQAVELPAAAVENLREVMAFEMDRHTPFRAEDVYFDCRVTRRDGAHNRITLELAVVPREVADRALELVRGWGLEPDRLGIGGEPVHVDKPFNLLPVAPAAHTLSHRLSVLLAVCAVVLGVLTFYMPLWQKQEVLSQTQSVLARARAAAAEVDALQRQVGDLVARSQFLVERKANRPSLTALLDEITRLLPDNTYIVQFALREQTLTVSGYSARASALIAEMEQSDMLSEVNFVSPVTLDNRIGLERFNISAIVTGVEP